MFQIHPQSAYLKLFPESGIGAGIRRIEAVTSEGAYQLMNEQIMRLHEVAEKLKAKPRDIVQRTESLLEEIKELQRENESIVSQICQY